MRITASLSRWRRRYNGLGLPTQEKLIDNVLVCGVPGGAGRCCVKAEPSFLYNHPLIRVVIPLHEGEDVAIDPGPIGQ